MIVALAIAAAPVAQPSPDFVRGCYERATTQAEIIFCTAGEEESKTHLIQDPEDVACFERDQSQMGMNRCAGDAFERADKALNAQWRKVLDAYGDDAEAKKLLLDGQSAWLKYRDAQCEIVAFDNRGGSIWPLVNSGCLADLTRKRTRQLAELIEGEGD